MSIHTCVAADGSNLPVLCLAQDLVTCLRTVGCDRNRMANLSKASNVVQEKYILYDVTGFTKYILYDVTGFTQKWHSIPVATNCRQQPLTTSNCSRAGSRAKI